MKKLFGKFGNFKNLLYLIKPYWKYGKLYLLGKLALAVLIAPALMLCQVRLIQSVIDAIAGGATMREAIITAAVILTITFALTVARWTFLLMYDRWKAEDIRIKINRSIYEQAIVTDYKYFDNPDFYNSFTFAAGELAAQSNNALQLLIEICATVSGIVTMTAYLSSVGPWVVLISVIGQAICLFAQRIIQKLGIKKTTEALPFERRLNYIHRIAYQKQYAADMKSSDLPLKILSMFDKSGKGKVSVFKKYAAANTWANMLQFAAWHLCQLIQLIYLIFCVYTYNIGVGTIAGMFTAAGKLNDQLNRFVGISGRLMEASLYADKIKAFFNYESEIEAQISGIEPLENSFSLELRDMSFSYPNSNFRLEKINIKISSGEKIAIVGENGAGKTTLAKLLLRLYDVNNGDILYNGISVREYDIHQLRKKIGVAFQESQLYALSVRDNMEIYNTSGDDTLQNVLNTVGLDIRLESEVTREFDDNGIILSGGQSQKLGLSRLLHGDFGLLLLDEPSSALDPLAEYELMKLIFEQSHTTTIMVAHRLSTIRDADRIYLVDNGGIAECGTHDELMKVSGKYAEMFNKQAENYVRQ